jgi:hypothetical protein
MPRLFLYKIRGFDHFTFTWFACAIPDCIYFGTEGIPNLKEKVYFTHQPMRVGTHHSRTYDNGFFTPDFLKTGQIIPEAVLKNHSKSQKNIVLDFKLIVLRSEHIIWNVLVHIFLL